VGAPGTAPLALTFLHRDGRLLLPQPQEDEEEHQGDEDLEGQHPLGTTQSRGIVTTGDRVQLRRSVGRTGGPRAASCRRLVAPSQSSQRHAGPWAPGGLPPAPCLHPACSTQPRAPRDRRGDAEGTDGALFQHSKRGAGTRAQPRRGCPGGGDPKPPEKHRRSPPWQCPHSRRLPSVVSPCHPCHHQSHRRATREAVPGAVGARFGSARPWHQLQVQAGGSAGGPGTPPVPSHKATAARDFHQRHMANHSKSPGIPDPNHAGGPGWAPCPEALGMGTSAFATGRSGHPACCQRRCHPPAPGTPRPRHSPTALAAERRATAAGGETEARGEASRPPLASGPDQTPGWR